MTDKSSLPTLWQTDPEATTAFPRLQSNLDVDVAIIGGGITGVTTARLLADQGLRVAVLEALTVGGGTTGYSTGNLYATVDHYLHKLRAKYDDETIQAIAASRTAAVDLVERLVLEHEIACDFVRAPWVLCSEHPDKDAIIDDELEAAKAAGLDARLATGDDPALPFPIRRAVHVARQAQLNPMTYVRTLAQAIASDGCRVYEHTPVLGYTEEEGGCTLEVEGGVTVTSRHVVMATHSPKGLFFVHTMLGPYREYAIACELASGELPPPGSWWILGAGGHHHSVRGYRDDHGKAWLVVVGEPHKVGQETANDELFTELERYARERFDVARVVYRWGAQNYRPADGLPHIGRRDDDSRVFIATGFAADGLVWGTLAAMLISDDLGGRKSPWADRFAFTKRRPLKSAKKFLEENANVALQYLKDLPLVVDARRFDDIAPGEGKTIEIDHEKFAAYRDDGGELHVVSALCTHMACVVSFNKAERSWDCPCHGSRFGVDGRVLEGPAYQALQRLSPQRVAEEVADEAGDAG